MEWMLLPYRRYAEFSGRSRRKEFWMFQLLNLIVMAVLYTLVLSGGGWQMLTADAALGRAPLDQPYLSEAAAPGPLFWVGAAILCLWALGSFIPSLAVTVRRLHDRNMTGWYLVGFIVMIAILSLIPLIGPLIVLVLEIAYIVILALPGTPGENRYGPDPLAARAPEGEALV